MRTSDGLDKLVSALVAAQKQIKGAHKTGVNPHFRSSYASLDDVFDAIRVPLNDNGLCVVQTVDDLEDRWPVVTTRLLHVSGQWVEGTCPFPAQYKQDPQGMGSAITYLRRYSLMALLAIPEADDDGNSAQPIKGKYDANKTNNNQQKDTKPTHERTDSAGPKPIQVGPSKGHTYPGDYTIVKFGKIENTKLKDLSDEQIIKMHEWLLSKAGTLNEKNQELLEEIERYMERS